MSGRFYRGLAIACGLLAVFGLSQLAAAQERGDQVVVIKKEAMLDIPGQGSVGVEPGAILNVRGTRGNWLRVEHQDVGWIAKDAVVLLADADNYLSKKTGSATAEFEDFYALAQLRGEKQGWQSAVSVYDMALQTFPESAMAYFQRGLAQSKLGKTKEAVADYEKSISLDANMVSAMNNLAWIRATGEESIRDGAQALKLATRASEITKGQDASVLDTLAAANAELGRFTDASRWQMAAIRLKDRGSSADALYQRLKLYSSKQAFRSKAK